RAALNFLTEANTRLESGLVAAQLAALQTDFGHYEDARRTLERYAELSPLMEPDVAKWLAARRADSSYFLGQYAEGASFAREVQDKFYDQFAERLDEKVRSSESGRSEEKGVRREGSEGIDVSLLTPHSSLLTDSELRTPPPRLKVEFPPAPAIPTVY